MALLCDGKRVAVSSGPRKWADTAETILSLGTTRLEAVGEDGTTLRVVELTADGVDQADEKQPAAAANMAALGKLSELAQLAQIIGDISDRAAARHEGAYKLAFGEYVKMNVAILERLSAMEQSWIMSLNTISDLKMQLADAIAEAQASKEGENGGLVGGLLSAAMGGGLETPAAAPAKANGKANGHATAKGKAS